RQCALPAHLTCGTARESRPRRHYYEGSAELPRRVGSAYRHGDFRFILDGLCGDLGLGADDVDAALKVGAVVDADAGALDVADEASLFANRDFSGDLHVAVDGAEDHDLAGFDVGAHLAVGSYGEQALGFHFAFDFAVDQQLFARVDVTLNTHRTADC